MFGSIPSNDDDEEERNIWRRRFNINQQPEQKKSPYEKFKERFLIIHKGKNS